MSKDITSQFTKTLGEQSGNARSHLDSVIVLHGETNKLHEVFAKDLANLTIEIAQLKEKVKKNPHELKKFLVEKLRPLEDELMIGEDIQKHENKSAQEIMTEIKRQNKETSQAIVKTFEKVFFPQKSQNIWKQKQDNTTDLKTLFKEKMPKIIAQYFYN